MSDAYYEEWMSEEQKGASEISIEELDGLVKEYLAKREEYEAAKKIQSEKYGEYQSMENKLMSTLKAAGKKTYIVDGVGRATIVQKNVITVPKELSDKRSLWDWIAAKYGKDALDDMLSIHSAKLTSWYNQESEQNKDNPLFKVPGIQPPTMVENLSFRRESK